MNNRCITTMPVLFFFIIGWFIVNPGTGSAWEIITGDGFGKSTNNGISIIFQAETAIISGTENFKTGTELYRLTDEGSWVLLKGGGLGDSKNTKIASMSYFLGTLYAGTLNTVTGAQLFTSDNLGGSWTRRELINMDKENYGISSMTVFKDRLFLGFRNPRGARIAASKDGKEFTTLISDGFGTRQNIDIPSLFPYQNRMLLAGVKNADIMTGKTAGARIYVTTDGKNWNLGYQFTDLGIEIAAISAFILTGTPNEMFAAGRGLLSGKMDRGMFFRGTPGARDIKFEKISFGYEYFPGITCLTTMDKKILAGTSSSQLLSLDPNGTVSEVILPMEIREYNGFVSALHYSSPYIYAGITYPTFPPRGAGLYRTKTLKQRLLKRAPAKRIVSSPADDVQLTSSGKTLLTFGGIIILLVIILFIVQKVKRT